LLSILPQEKIILVLPELTDEYYDKDGVIKKFEGAGTSNPDNRKYLNYFWDKLNNYFISKLPNIKLIDMRKTGYIGNENYPFGISPGHYESQYYKEFLNRVLKVHQFNLNSNR